MPSTSDSSVDPCIVFEHVRKTFNIRKSRSAKEAFVSTFKRGQKKSRFDAVDDLSFEVFPGESIALLGRNGSGKSTTLKLLSGVLRPSEGWIGTQGRVAGLLEVGAGFHPNLTGRENVYLNAAILGMSREETDERFDRILAFSEIGEFIDTEVKRYSSGMYSRLGFSVAVHTELDVLLVDEILSVGDAQFRAKCNEKMLELQGQGKTMFIVSHNAAQVKKLCQRGLVLEKGRKVFDGGIGEAVAHLNPKPASKRTGQGAPSNRAPQAVPGKPQVNETEIEEQGAQVRTESAGARAVAEPTAAQESTRRPPVPGSLQHRLATQNQRQDVPVAEQTVDPSKPRARHGA